MVVEKLFVGMCDLFSSVFFVFIGMLIDVKLLVDVWLWIIGLGVFVLVVCVVVFLFVLILCGMFLCEV